MYIYLAQHKVIPVYIQVLAFCMWVHLYSHDFGNIAIHTFKMTLIYTAENGTNLSTVNKMAGPIGSLTKSLHCIYTRLSACSSSPRVLTAASRQSELIASDLNFFYSPIILAGRSPIAWVAHLQDAVSSVVGIQPYVPGRIATVRVTWGHKKYIYLTLNHTNASRT